MASDVEIAWAAGLIEGEGCFTKHTGHPYLLVDMTDKDVLERLKEIFPTGTIRGPYSHKHKEHHKPRWRFDAFGTKAIPIINAVYPYLLSRRKEKVDSLLNDHNCN